MLQESLGDHDHINSVFEDIALSEDRDSVRAGVQASRSPGVLNLLYLNCLSPKLDINTFLKLLSSSSLSCTLAMTEGSLQGQMFAQIHFTTA